MINQKWIKGGVNNSFYFIWAMPKKSRGVHVNRGVTSGIYFMYDYFLKTDQVQNESKHIITDSKL